MGRVEVDTAFSTTYLIHIPMDMDHYRKSDVDMDKWTCHIVSVNINMNRQHFKDMSTYQGHVKYCKCQHIKDMEFMHSSNQCQHEYELECQSEGHVPSIHNLPKVVFRI